MADQPVAEFSSATARVLLGTDASLSPALEIAGEPLSVVYAPHGHRSSASAEGGPPRAQLGFNGELLDQACGLYLLGPGNHRPYSPALGMFVAPDALGTSCRGEGWHPARQPRQTVRATAEHGPATVVCRQGYAHGIEGVTAGYVRFPGQGPLLDEHEPELQRCHPQDHGATERLGQAAHRDPQRHAQSAGGVAVQISFHPALRLRNAKRRPEGRRPGAGCLTSNNTIW